MRPEPVEIARGFGAGVHPDPVFHDDTGWTQHKVARKVTTDYNVRCQFSVRLHGTDGLIKTCNNMLAVRVTRPYTLFCRKCKNETIREADE